MANTKDQTASPGTHFAGPLYVEASDPAQADFAAVPDITDSSGGTASETLAAQSVALTGVDGTDSDAAPLAGTNAQLVIIRNSIASLAAAVNALAARLQ